MPIADCRLCGCTRELRNSHLVPQGLYKVLGAASRADGQANPNPIRLTPDVAIQTSKQVSDYLLCEDCEDHLNKSGEKWMIANCWRSDTQFALREAIVASKPVHIGSEGFQLFRGCDIGVIDLPKMIHFAAGVFWRAAAHDWSRVEGPARLNFGTYEEKLREFVLGNREFPRDVALLVRVNSIDDSGSNQNVIFPFLRARRSGCQQYGFVIPGVAFQIFLGKGIGDRLLRASVTSGDGFIVLEPNDPFLFDMEKVRRKATPKGQFATLLADLERATS